MKNLVFEDRAVAFIDVLGFKTIVSEASTEQTAFNKLQSLVNILDDAVPDLDKRVEPNVPDVLIPKHINISDSIILSAPLTVTLPGWNHYSGLDIIIMRVVQLTHVLLSSGYLIRGGIAIGKVWHGDSDIVGPAYQDAYTLETKTCMPRVVLSDNARDYWLRTNNASRICIPYEGIFMVNGLFDYYIQNVHLNIETAFKEYLSTIKDNLNNVTHPECVKDKWKWFGQYLIDEYPHAKKWSTVQS